MFPIIRLLLGLHSRSYIRGRATVICCTLSPNHEAVKCLSAFGDQAQKFVAEVLATIKWGTQHWKLQEPFPVPVIPKWLRTPEFTQTMTPLRGELPLMPTGSHFEDIHMHCPAMWSWMAVLLQYWQDHMTRHLYRGRFHQISDLAATLIRDINSWLHISDGGTWPCTPCCGLTSEITSPRSI